MSRQVAAIVWEGRSDVELHGAFGGIAGLTPGFGVSNHLGRVSSDLAAALAPPPGPPSRSAWFKWIVALLALAACPFGLIAVVAGGAAARRGYATFVIGIAAIVVLLIVLWARRLRRDLRWRRAMPEIGAVWSAARYCGRCAVVYFPRSEIPASLPDHVGPGGFRDLVWRAGIIRRESRQG